MKKFADIKGCRTKLTKLEQKSLKKIVSETENKMGLHKKVYKRENRR